jgi:hypothetical protein
MTSRRVVEQVESRAPGHRGLDEPVNPAVDLSMVEAGPGDENGGSTPGILAQDMGGREGLPQLGADSTIGSRWRLLQVKDGVISDDRPQPARPLPERRGQKWSAARERPERQPIRIHPQ